MKKLILVVITAIFLTGCTTWNEFVDEGYAAALIQGLNDLADNPNGGYISTPLEPLETNSMKIQEIRICRSRIYGQC